MVPRWLLLLLFQLVHTIGERVDLLVEFAEFPGELVECGLRRAWLRRRLFEALHLRAGTLRLRLRELCLRPCVLCLRLLRRCLRFGSGGRAFGLVLMCFRGFFAEQLASLRRFLAGFGGMFLVSGRVEVPCGAAQVGDCPRFLDGCAVCGAGGRSARMMRRSGFQALGLLRLGLRLGLLWLDLFRLDLLRLGLLRFDLFRLGRASFFRRFGQLPACLPGEGAGFLVFARSAEFPDFPGGFPRFGRGGGRSLGWRGPLLRLQGGEQPQCQHWKEEMSEVRFHDLNELRCRLRGKKPRAGSGVADGFFRALRGPGRNQPRNALRTSRQTRRRGTFGRAASSSQVTCSSRRRVSAANSAGSADAARMRRCFSSAA